MYHRRDDVAILSMILLMVCPPCNLGPFWIIWASVPSSNSLCGRNRSNYVLPKVYKQNPSSSSINKGKKKKISERDTGWWFQIFFIFTPIPGEDLKFDTNFLSGLKPPTRRSHHMLHLFYFQARQRNSKKYRLSKRSRVSICGWVVPLPSNSDE